MSVKERIKLFCRTEGITISAFENSIGASNGYVNAISKSIGIDRINLLLEKYSNLNIEWLLTGKGEMVKTKCTPQHNYVDPTIAVHNKNTEISADTQISDTQNSQTRPRIPLEAAAGSLSIALTSVSQSECEQLPIIPTLPQYDFTIVARGESMLPAIESGDELACRFIHESAFIQWGRIHVLDTAQGIVVKRIFESDGRILCRSDNKNYPDFPVTKEEIHHMALVVGLLRHF